MYQKLGKRTFDIILAVTGLTILLPLFILISPILWVHFKGKPFFCQPRPGLHEKVFTLLKFRSIPEHVTESGDSAISAIGNFLRKTSLDELPQLWNVLRGDMSFVGPRPLLTEYLPMYSPYQRLRHSVLPGITGLAQVNGRNSIGWAEKFEYDLQYVQNQSFLLDLKILFLTIERIITRRGINDPDNGYVKKFQG
ncbi:sugar transferase [Dyadobacter arcticus]|uniref:Lipopolysaccharide/colanic/teichoic acid biosynthesis glycosyltransferase n=1 Tax=Dyadobacter arcticus TaxID=1078754 RepID=A0ABX0UEL2_9BACT|nr:sugar transferase [Dyadobacter arcticus]NIJ51097.1 lipopolysaccharide/colanic/teichoic acid biosynthesis glycosyltransferase [Dyadobacter arcticus]